VVEPDNLEARVAALESRVRELADLVAASQQRVKANERDAAAWVLAGGADRDVTEFRHELRDFRQASPLWINHSPRYAAGSMLLPPDNKRSSVSYTP
jgi:hypothetical protein